MDTNSLILITAFVWAIVWVVLPDKILAKRPTLKRIFFVIYNPFLKYNAPAYTLTNLGILYSV